MTEQRLRGGMASRGTVGRPNVGKLVGLMIVKPVGSVTWLGLVSNVGIFVLIVGNVANDVGNVVSGGRDVGFTVGLGTQSQPIVEKSILKNQQKPYTTTCR
jgi:hypothetical protein